MSRQWRQARRAGSIWRVSGSFPELAHAVLEHAQPDRIDIVRAKRHLVGQLGDGQPHPTGTLIASVAALLGAERLGRPQIDLPSRDSVKTFITADHPIPAAIRARTERSLREAIESCRRGVFLAASNLLGAGVEGALYAAGQRLRTAAPRADALVDGDHTAQLQGAVAAALRDCLPGDRNWEADALSQFVEHGPTKRVLQHPQHSYTVQLLDAVPKPFAATPEGSHHQ